MSSKHTLSVSVLLVLLSPFAFDQGLAAQAGHHTAAHRSRNFAPNSARSAKTSAISINSIFLETTTYSSGGDDAYSVAASDVNGDGKIDLIVTNICGASYNCETENGTVGVLLGNGDGTFQTAVTYASGGAEAVGVAVADVDGDGVPDIVVANECASNTVCTNGVLGVLLGNGDGTFRSAVPYGSGGFGTTSVQVADVNGDGKPDLVTANECASSTTCNDGTVTVLLGNGDGTFRLPKSYDSGGVQAESVHVADVNGDGKPDIVVANYCTNSSSCVETMGNVGVLLGNGDGTFQAPLSYGSGGYSTTSLAVADVNADGKVDLLASNGNDCSTVAVPPCDSGNTVGVLLGNGDGTFQPVTTYAAGGYGASVAAADVNGDGKPDLLVAGQNQYLVSNYLTGVVSVMFGNGDGTFQAPMIYDTGTYSADFVVAADVNGDGKLDLLVADTDESVTTTSNGFVGVLLGNGNGTFQASRSYSSGGENLISSEPYPYSVAAADVNGDGKLDLLVANEYSCTECTTGTVAVLLGNGDGTFQTPTSYSSGGTFADSVATADLNGDGKLDLVVVNAGPPDGIPVIYSSVGVLLGNGDGTFQAPVVYELSPYTAAESVLIADVNGDGKPDLLVSSESVSVLLGNGDGTFQPPIDTYGGGYATIAVGDVNGDGKPDLLAANYYGVAVFIGNGDGTFQPPVDYSSGGYASGSVVVGDVNGDGKLDLLVSNACLNTTDCTTGSVGVLLGNGDGTFQPAATIPTPDSVLSYKDATSLILADFNGDGKLDLASAFGDFLLLGNGDGTFQSPLSLGAPGIGMATGDFNRDGKPDLAVEAADAVVVLLNTSASVLLPTTTTLSSSMNPSLEGKPVSFSAAVSSSSGTPSGSVKFMNGTAILATVQLKSGKAEFTTSLLPAGVDSITAVYSGNSKYAVSTSGVVKQVVLAPTTTTLASSLDPSRYGETVKFVATVTSPNGAPPNGEVVTFEQGSTVLGTAHLSGGRASFSTSTLTVGDHKIRAIYSGGFAFAPSASEVLSQLVEKAGSTATLSR